MPGGITATELDCAIAEESAAVLVTPLEKVIWDEAFVDKFTDEAIAVVASTDAAVTVAELDCGTGEVPVGLIVTSPKKVIWDEALVDKLTDEAVAVVSIEAAVNVWLGDVSNLEVSDTTISSDDFIVDELLVRAVNSLE